MRPHVHTRDFFCSSASVVGVPTATMLSLEKGRQRDTWPLHRAHCHAHGRHGAQPPLWVVIVVGVAPTVVFFVALWT